MSAESQVYDALRVNGPLGAIVGNRIYPDAIAEGEAMPAIVFSRAATEPVISIDGTLHADRVTMRVECWAATRSAAEEACNAAVNALIVARIFYTNRSAGFDPEAGACGAFLDLDVWV